MYDASEGSYSGAHISMQTKSGTNTLHGGVYEYHQTDGWNATPFFFNADPSLHDVNGPTHGNPRPYLKRNTFGGTLGGPIIKEKLFFFASYQGQRAVDEDSSISEANVLPGLSDSNRSDPAALAKLADQSFNPMCGTGTNAPCLTASDINPTALTILNLKLHNGQYFIPSENADGSLGYNALVIGPKTTFSADQVNGNIDYIFSSRDRIAGKYYYQHDPTYAPFVISQVGNFPQQLNAGSQLFSLENSTTISPNAVWTQRFGFVRELAYAHTIDGYSNSDYGLSVFGLSTVPGINIGTANPVTGKSLAIGPANNFSNAGVFQNTFESSTKYSWTLGRHTFAFGAQWDKTQLNVVNKNNQTALVNFADFSGFLTGTVCNPTVSCGSAGSSVFVNGETNRYFRSSQVGLFSQDTWRVRQNLTVTLGLRWDWNGPLVEKYGRLTNFYPSKFDHMPCTIGGVAGTPSGGTACDAGTDVFNGVGIVVAGNNKDFPTKGVSDSTLTGRQWGFAPRIGIAWTPGFTKNLVVRAGYGLYYDRGEYFAELSPSAGGGVGGPFGVTVEAPFALPYYSQPGDTFAVPFGAAAPPPPPKDLTGVESLIPNVQNLINNTTPFCIKNGVSFCGPLQFAGYDPSNKLPYTENWLLDLQWQPRSDLVFTLSFVGNHGQHEVIPVPFNQPQVATNGKPINGQVYSYGYNVPGVSAENISTLVEGYGAGNVDLRVPYVGFDPNSQYARAAGISNYDALQFNVTKRASHGLTVSGSYTWSHAMDEESGEQLFYNGDNPQDLRTGYGNSDFDRRHVFAISYMYSFPALKNLRGFLNQAINGWGTSGVISAESGQPYSVIDFTGGIASLYYGGGEDFITNPLVPIGGVGSTAGAKAVLQGTLGVDPSKPVLNPAAFGIPLLQAGDTTYGVPPCDQVTKACDNYETAFGAASRNIFVGPFQSRVDMSLFKNFKINERFALKFDVQAFNIFNHPSFDTPNNNVQFNPYYANPPQYGAPNCAPPDAYVCPPAGQLGLIQHTIGSPRFLQMALHLTF